MHPWSRQQGGQPVYQLQWRQHQNTGPVGTWIGKVIDQMLSILTLQVQYSLSGPIVSFDTDTDLFQERRWEFPAGTDNYSIIW